MNFAHWGWPQAVFAALLLMANGVAIARFGEEKKRDTYDIIDVLIGPAITWWLLYMGGFWS